MKNLTYAGKARNRSLKNEVHMGTQTGEKPRVYKKCNKIYTMEHHLRHMRIQYIQERNPSNANVVIHGERIGVLYAIKDLVNLVFCPMQ